MMTKRRAINKQRIFQFTDENFQLLKDDQGRDDTIEDVIWRYFRNQIWWEDHMLPGETYAETARRCETFEEFSKRSDEQRDDENNIPFSVTCTLRWYERHKLPGQTYEEFLCGLLESEFEEIHEPCDDDENSEDNSSDIYYN